MDGFEEMSLQKQRQIEEQKMMTEEQQLDQRKQKEMLEQAPEMQREQDALQQVRLRVSRNMPKTLKETMRGWKINGSQERIRKGKSAKGVLSPDVQSVKNHMAILRNALGTPLAENTKERESQAKRIGESMRKVRELCDGYLGEHPEEPQNAEEKKNYDLIKKIRESLGDEGEGFSKDVDAILKLKKVKSVENWMALLPEETRKQISAGADES